jgi:hypothetical protein
MKKVSVEKVLRWMLAAWMLLATSVTSSTFMHNHSGGDMSHQHDRSDSQSSVLLAVHDSHDGDVSSSAADVHRHGCLALFGAVTYLPMPGGPTGSGGKSLAGWETMVAVSASQDVRTLAKGLTIDHSGLASLAVLSTSCICESKQHETLCAGAAPASPLCDRARHERSGVQLA